MRKVEIKSKFQLGEKVLFLLKDASKEPCRSNTGKVGKILEIFPAEKYRKEQNFYLVKFGPGVWDEVCAPEDELSEA